MERASSATVVFDLTMVALADMADRPAMSTTRFEVARPATTAPAPTPGKARVIPPKSTPAPTVAAAAPIVSKPRAAVITGQQQKRLAAEKGADGRPMRPYAIRPGFIATPAKTCQWIEGEPTPDDSCKCGRRSVAGLSYCLDHAQRAYRVLPRSVVVDPSTSPTP